MTASRNQRASDRLNEQAIIFIERQAASDALTGQAEIVVCRSLDISRGGMRVAVDEEFEAGLILQLGVELRELGETLYLVGEVIRCTAADQGYELAFQLFDSDGTDIADWRVLIEELEST